MIVVAVESDELRMEGGAFGIAGTTMAEVSVLAAATLSAFFVSTARANTASTPNTGIVKRVLFMRHGIIPATSFLEYPMKKIRLALCVLALLALPISHASAFSHSFSNETDHTVYFLVDYTACPSDSWDVKAGETITWRSGLCCIKATSAKIDNSTEQGR